MKDRESGTRGCRFASPKRTAGRIATGFLIFAGAFLFLGLFLAVPGPSAEQAREEEGEDVDFPELFRELARYLKLHYLDLDRVNPRPLLEKAFWALENAADEIYVENSDPKNPRLAVHVDSRTQVFNLESVDDLDDAVKLLENLFEFLKRNYKGELSLNEIRYAAANGFLTGLDPHTLVFSPDAFKDFSVHIEGEIYGVGMFVGTRDGKLTVIEVLKGPDESPNPAFRAGFKKGDQIAKIGDESTINMTVNEAVDKIRGKQKTTVTLTIKRPSTDDPEKLETLVIPVERDKVEIKSVESKLIPDWNRDGTGPWKGGVGYVKVVNFDKNTMNGLKAHLASLKKQNGGNDLSGLVFDLRDNSGGLLTQAVEMCDLFLKSGSIVITASRGERLQAQGARDDGSEPAYPIVILANEASASGAEIVIGALQKNHRALILGTRTFGKGSVQQLHRLPNAAQLKITVSEYLIPEKISIQENGVVPDIEAKAAIIADGDYDVFPNERSLTEKNYETHIVSRYAKKESPAYRVDYLYDPPKEDIYSDRFMSGNLEPEKDKLVQMALKLLVLSGKPFESGEILKKKAEIEKLKGELFQEVVERLEEKGIDWSPAPEGAAETGDEKLELSLSSEMVKEPSGDKEDPVPVNKLHITAKLTNKGDKPLYRLKGLSKSEYFLYKDQEFLFGKVAPGETVARSVKVRLPYFPHTRNDLFTVEVSSTPNLPLPAPAAGQDPGAAGKDSPAIQPRVLTVASMQVDLQDSGRPAFAYSARLLDKKNRQSISTLGAGSEAVLEVKVRNVGGATAHKGVVILRNETGRQVFLQRGRLDFSELKSQGETQVDLEFDVRDGDPVDHYKFELAIVDSYSGATLVRKLAIEPRDKEDAALFPNGVEFVPPEITAALVDPETRKPVILTGRESLKLEAVIKSRDTDPFKAWIYSSSPSDNDLPPDKIYYIDSRGEPELRIATSVPLKKGLNLFTVVSNDRSGLESRQNIVVRRE